MSSSPLLPEAEEAKEATEAKEAEGGRGENLDLRVFNVLKLLYFFLILLKRYRGCFHVFLITITIDI